MCKTCDNGICTNGCVAGPAPAAQPQGQPKGGKISRAAVMLCKNPQFRIWLDRRAKTRFGIPTEDGTHTEEDAKAFVLRWCQVDSRALLDHDHEAAQRFGYLVSRFKKYRDEVMGGV